MSCGLGKLLNYVTCGCFCGPSTTVVDDDETDETAALVPAIRAQSKKIEALTKELKEASALRDQYKGMKGRSYSHYSPQEKGLFNALSAPKPFSFSSLTHPAAPQPATGMRQRVVPDQVKKDAEVIQAAVVGQKYTTSGVKLGNWDTIKAGVLGAIIGQLETQGMQGAKLIQVLNALPIETKKDFADIGVTGLNLS